MNAFTVCRANLYKSLHTPVWAVHAAVPLLGAAVLVWYASFSAMGEGEKMALYLQALSIVYPLLIGLITAMEAEREQNAAACQALFLYPGVKCVVPISAFGLLLLYGLGASVLASAGFGLGFRWLGHTILPLIFYIKAAGVLWVSMLPLYGIHYMLGFARGKGCTIGLGVAGSLLAALLLTGLGDGIWWMLPWGIAARMPMLFLMAELSDAGDLWYHEMRQGGTALLVFSGILLILLILFFQRWEGRKSED